MIQPVVVYQNRGNILNQKTIELDIQHDSEKIESLAQQLIQTIKFLGNGCLGLAAPQIGSQYRICGIRDVDNNISVLINPRITSVTHPTMDAEPLLSSEACFSIPDVSVEVIRHSYIVVEYIEYPSMESKEIIIEGERAVVYQHEIDHLDGIIVTDYLTPLKRRLIENKLKRISRGNVPVYYPVQIQEKNGSYSMHGTDKALHNYIESIRILNKKSQEVNV
jgi:peptide deformylase